MSAELSGGVGGAAALVIGAGGAIAAIFLKEAVQAAMQRRVIAWQLFGYLIAWRSLLARHGQLVIIYDKVKERNHALTTAVSQNTAEFQRVHLQQYQERSELREKIKETLIKEIGEADLASLSETFHSVLITEATGSLAEQRKLLADSKSFISDRDAALLGRAPAMNVVQFRTSLLNLLMAMEGILKLLPHKSDQTPKTIASVVDQMILNGEDMLVAMIRLEGNVESISQKTLYGLTLEILRGR